MCEVCDYAYELPPGKRWRFLGTCPCGGNDMACAEDDKLWEIVDDDSED